MDVKVSKKERRIYQDGVVDVVLDNICDFFPVFADDLRYSKDKDLMRITSQERENIIMDIEMIDDSRTEMLDRAMFAMMKQRGGDPAEPEDGIQWAEAVLGEIPPTRIIQQVQQAVAEEGPGVRAAAHTVKNGGNETLAFKIDLTGM